MIGRQKNLPCEECLEELDHFFLDKAQERDFITVFQYLWDDYKECWGSLSL